MAEYRAMILIDQQLGYGPQPVADTCIASEHAPIDTGLLTAQGTKIFRMPRKEVLGFAIP